MTVQQILVKQLGALPAIRACLDRPRLKERVDAVAPVRDVARLTNGDVGTALVVNRLTAPRPLYDIVAWAEEWAVEETFGIAPSALNDDRLGRCLDDVAAVHDRLRGDLTVQASGAFGLETTTVRWDLTSVLVPGEYPPEEQVAGYAQVRYGYSSGRQKPVRYLQVTTDDGAVPIWDQVHDGNTTAVATVIETMAALRAHARCSDFVLVGDSKLLPEANRRARLAAGVGSLAPLARTPELDAAFLAIEPDALLPLEYMSARDATTRPEERATYHGFAGSVEVVIPTAAGGERRQRLQRVFVLSSEEQAACRRNRARQRERAETEIAKVVGRVGSRWYPTAERARAKIEAILEQRHLSDLYRVSGGEVDGRPTVICEPMPAALARAEALDGYYVLETTRAPEDATPSALPAQWTGPWQIEHRHRRAKGPLRVRPLFVTSHQRIVGLITVLGSALMVFSLLERAARRALGPAAKVPNLLAGHVAARPTGDNLLKAPRSISLVTLDFAGTRHRAPSDLTPLHRTVLHLLDVPAAAYARLAA